MVSCLTQGFIPGGSSIIYPINALIRIDNGTKLTDMEPDINNNRINAAISLAIECGQIDGAHHKMWVIDQMIRILAGDYYDSVIATACNGEDGPETYIWDTGIAP